MRQSGPATVGSSTERRAETRVDEDVGLGGEDFLRRDVRHFRVIAMNPGVCVIEEDRRGVVTFSDAMAFVLTQRTPSCATFEFASCLFIKRRPQIDLLESFF